MGKCGTIFSTMKMKDILLVRCLNRIMVVGGGGGEGDGGGERKREDGEGREGRGREMEGRGGSPRSTVILH